MGCGGSSGNNNPDAAGVDAPKADGGGGGGADAPKPDAPPVSIDARITPDAPNNPQADAGPPPDAGCTTDPGCEGGAGNSCNAAGEVITCTAVPGFNNCFHASAGTPCDGVQTCQGAGVCTCPTTACTGLNAGDTICGPNGGEQTCTADAQSCLSLSAEVACADVAGGAPGLVCNAAAGSAGHCDCSTTDTGAHEGGFCSTLGMQVCEVGNANNENNVLVCGSVMLGTHTCQAWSTFGGAGGMGDCRGAGVTCDPVAHECACPAHTGNVWFANPVNVTDRTLFHQLGLVETGVQQPPACSFETATVAVQHGQAQITAGTAAGAVVVLSGGTSPFAPAIFDNETWDSTWDIGEGMRITVDTDTTLVGINPPQGVTFDPRNAVLVYNGTGRDAALFLSGGIGGAGNKLHGFTITGGASTDTFVAAVEDQGGTGVRLDSMLLEGGGGQLLDGSTADAPKPGALTVNSDRTVTMTFAESDTDIRAGLAAAARFVLVNGATALSHDGVFQITDVSFPDADTVAITYFTNVPGLAADTAATWAISAQGPLWFGLEVDGGTGSYNSVMVENFSVAGVAKAQPQAATPASTDGLGIEVNNTAAGGVTFSGLYLFNNWLGMETDAGTVTITSAGIPNSPLLGGPAGGFLTTFAHAVDQPMIEHSLVNGFENDGATVTANNLRVFDTTDDFGVGAFDGTLHLVSGSIDTNAGGGLDVDGAFWVTADTTTVSSNLGDGVFIDSAATNVTLTNTKIDSNAGTGLNDQGQLVFVFGGADTTINSNNLGVNLAAGGTINVNVPGDLANLGVVNVTSNNQSGITANSGTLNLSKAEVDSNSVNSSLGVCDDSVAQQPAISITGSATLNLTASAVQTNNGAGLFIASNSTATIDSGNISNNAAALPDCDGDFGFDGIEALSTVHFVGGASNVNGNHGNGIEVHNGGIVTTAGGGVTVGSNDLNGIVINQTGSATLHAADVVTANCQTGGTAGILVAGTLSATGTNVNNNKCDGILVARTGGSQTFMSGITSTANTGDGVHVVSAPGVGETADDGTEAPVADTDMGAQIVAGSIITANGSNGIEMSGGDSVYLLVADSFIDSNGAAGIAASGGDDDGSAATFLSLVHNVIVGNIGAGLTDAGAHLRAATISGTVNAGFAKNDIEHNGFASETQCLSGESTAQIVFSGPLVQIGGTDCTTQNADVTTCEQGVAPHCIFNPTTSQCFHAYWLQGGTTDTCDNQNTNIISGYAGETSTNQTGANVVGVNAVGGAAVNASGNTWKHSSPALTIDINNDAASFVKRVGACQAHNTCIPAPH